MPAPILAVLVFAQLLLFAPAESGVPLITVIYDRSDFSFPSETRCPHESTADPVELFTMGGAPRSDEVS